MAVPGAGSASSSATGSLEQMMRGLLSEAIAPVIKRLEAVEMDLFVDEMDAGIPGLKRDAPVERTRASRRKNVVVG